MYQIPSHPQPTARGFDHREFVGAVGVPLLQTGGRETFIGALPDEELVPPQNYRHDGENKLHSPLF